jgi:hypothetical protein
MKIEQFEGITRVKDITDDMGSEAKLAIFVEQDGDVILTLADSDKEGCVRRAKAGVGQEITIQFCTAMGGGHKPLIARKLRELVMLLAEENSKG